MSKRANSRLPTVSICIPVFNAARTIHDTINSVLNQTYPNIKIVVVDDCSTDASAQIIKGFISKGVNYIRNNKNLGINANWQKTILMADGKYVILLGHDDMLLPECVSRIITFFEQDNEIGMVGFRAKSLPSKKITSRPTYGRISPLQVIESLIKFENITPPSEIMYRVSAVKEVSGFDTGYNYCPEVTLAMKLSLNGWGTFNVDEILGIRLAHAGSVTSKVSIFIPLKDKLKFIINYRHKYSLSKASSATLSIINRTFQSFFRNKLAYFYRSCIRHIQGRKTFSHFDDN